MPEPREEYCEQNVLNLGKRLLQAIESASIFVTVGRIASKKSTPASVCGEQMMFRFEVALHCSLLYPVIRPLP